MIPIYEAKINEAGDGIFCISLVDSPAVESDFVAFNQQKYVNYSIQDDEQRLITGVLMRAEWPIYRMSNDLGEYYIKYSKETIKKMAEKLLDDGYQNQINLMHTPGTITDGVNLMEIFIKDSSKGISPAGFESIEDGSLFCTYKVNNNQIWQEIKDGTFKGFSIEGYFSIIPTSEQMKTQKNNNNIMNRLTKKFMAAIVKFNSVNTDKGELFWAGESDLEIGDELFQNDGEDKIKVEDGTYKTEDGTEITVSEGLVTYIQYPEINEIQSEECTSASTEEFEEQETEEQDPEQETEEQIEETDEEKNNEESKLKADIDDLRKEHEELKQEIENLKATLESIIQKPVAEPIVDEYEKTVKKSINSLGSKIKPTLGF